MPYIEFSNKKCPGKHHIKIMAFTEGTVLGPKSFFQFFNCSSYIPIGSCIDKMKQWEEQGAEIIYCTSRKRPKYRSAIAAILARNHFPGTRLYYRIGSQKYSDITEEILPDILIEDDCKSIGGQWQMCITHVRPEIKSKIKSIVIKEFKGIDFLPSSIEDLAEYQSE